MTHSAEARLAAYYDHIQGVILTRQNPITGLLPASTAVNAHGDYTDAWVRDNVYSILGVWGLALAYRRVDDNLGRSFELEHSIVKLMRGLLFAMMRQAVKVEQFKNTQSPRDALHAKYDTPSGQTVVGDHAWGHLQLDATSLYLLMLAQMTASGLNIIYTIDEVNFIQNLVYYIGRTYRTPDYGIWERGNKINHGFPELNTSSIGMAKAALEAMNGLDLFGARGSQRSVIHVLPDEIARARITLESLLPRESGSKEIDAALLSIISFPAFAVDDPNLVARTRDEIVQKLEGRYGCKRFLRDGHQTVLEDTSRLHYEPVELKQFEHIECEWPLFFTYLTLDGLFRQDAHQARHYQQRLEAILIDNQDFGLVPELYYVPSDCIAQERTQPSSQTRLPNANIPLVWAQSLYLLGCLLGEGLLHPEDIDPLGRYRMSRTRSRPVVQVALLSEDEQLQLELAAQGIPTQTLEQVHPVQVRYAHELSIIYTQIGRNQKLGLTGRPVRRLRGLTTSRVYRICGESLVFLPSFLNLEQFYLTLDSHFLVSQIKSELTYIHEHWSQRGRPTVTLLITWEMVQAGRAGLLTLMKELGEGTCSGIPVRLGPLHQLMLTAGQERIDFLHDFTFSTAALQGHRSEDKRYLAFDPSQTAPLGHVQELALDFETGVQASLTRLQHTANLYEQIELLQLLVRLKGLDFDTHLGAPDAPAVLVQDLIAEVYLTAGLGHQNEHPVLIEPADTSDGTGYGGPYWAVVRRAAGLLGKVDIGLSDAVTILLVRQKQISVGKAYSEDALINRPLTDQEVVAKINEFCREDIRDRVLTQEVIISLSLLMRANPRLFTSLLTLRVGYLILLITTDLAQEHNLTQDEAYEQVMHLSPYALQTHLARVLADYEEMHQVFFLQESLHTNHEQISWLLAPTRTLTPPVGGWFKKRQRDGTLNRVPRGFYPKVWLLLRHCRGLIIGDKLERRNRLDSELILAQMTPGEGDFALWVEHLLNKIAAPQYRQVNIEALMTLASLVESNPGLLIADYIVMDVLIGHAVRLVWLETNRRDADHYEDYKASAWRAFYESAPQEVATYVIAALQFLTQLGQDRPLPTAP
ncbi:glycoside hydrolase family 15 protein [Anthocerotibacter panamensis]|uniref:glycoside hydrolase family 15 protein n=1 Tax=Anthocerotibacter panamensis TaxID=2857077 RepID=UPI001C401D0A|nr:glycoside hydrolase family 15 protein [Anthocerotibacter panamensis]